VTTSVLAHQGGWDELLMVLVPIAIFALLLVVANRRASAIERQNSEGGGQAGAPGGSPGGPEGPSAG
jgi:hypothetical protein